MKSFISTILLGVIIILLGSCKKDINTAEVINSNSIAGKWELRKIIGGFRGVYPEKNYPPGNGNIWVFSDSMYQIYYSNIVSDSGNYLLGRDFANATGQITNFLMLLPIYGKIYFKIENNSLTLYRGELSYDGTIEKYERIENYR
jgi:hypothetical protein